MKSPPRGGGTPYNGLGSAKRGTFLRMEVYKWLAISWAEVYKRVGKTVIIKLRIEPYLLFWSVMTILFLPHFLQYDELYIHKLYTRTDLIP